MNISPIKKLYLVLAISSLSTILTGCFSDDKTAAVAVPEANDANCKPEVIASIEPISARERFTRKCASRGVIKQSTGKTWEPGDLY